MKGLEELLVPAGDITFSDCLKKKTLHDLKIFKSIVHIVGAKEAFRFADLDK